jgi:hypothetical protein
VSQHSDLFLLIKIGAGKPFLVRLEIIVVAPGGGRWFHAAAMKKDNAFSPKLKLRSNASIPFPAM